MSRDVILASGSRLVRWLTAFGVLALCVDVAAAQAQDTVEIDSVKLSGLDEQSTVTATVKFTLKAGDADVDALDATVRFKFDVAGIENTPEAKAAEQSDFSGLTDDENASRATVAVGGVKGGVKAGAEAEHTATYVFGLNHDADAEDEKFKLHVIVDWASAAPATHTTDVNTIDDDEEQTYELSIPQYHRENWITEGALHPVTLIVNPPRTSLETAPNLVVVADSGSAPNDWPDAGRPVNPGTDNAVAVGNIGATVDGNRREDAITLKLLGGKLGAETLEDTLVIRVDDIHALPAPDAVTVEAFDGKNENDRRKVASVTEGGDPVYLRVAVKRDAGKHRNNEKLTVDVRAADAAQAADVTIAPTRIEFEATTTVDEQYGDALVELSALMDEDVGAEKLVLDLELTGEAKYGPGSSKVSFELDIVDATEKQVFPMPDDDVNRAVNAAIEKSAGDQGLNPGESFEVMTADLFTVAPGYTATYAASVTPGGDAVSASASSTAVTVNATATGTATVTVTATATGASSAIPQTVSNVARVAFDVTVGLTELVVKLKGPADMNVTEGMSATVTAEANRPVEADTVVELLQTGGTASPADYTVGSITIKAGETTGATTLTVKEDDSDDSGETLTIEGRFGAEKTNALEFTLWDMAVPALPLVAQLLLVTFLGRAGYGRIRRP